MASFASNTLFLVQLLVAISLFHVSTAGRKLQELYNPPSNIVQYHGGRLLSGEYKINVILYGQFKPSEKSAISDFINSLSTTHVSQPSVATWWSTIGKYYTLADSKAKADFSTLSITLGNQILDEDCSLGKSLTQQQIVQLASKGEANNAISVVLTSSDVSVEGLCSSMCGTHGSSASTLKQGENNRFTYIWVGNSETRCPGQCAWPFHQPIYGPQTTPLTAPNGVGVDGIIMNLASLLAGTVTNPYGNAFYQGDASAPLEAASACPGVYGNGAYSGNPGKLLKDATTGASYNAHGAGQREFLLPSIYDPSTSSCSTLV